ncbi:transcription factor A, mitochondrial isoform X2 [Agrilus planipennis]|nr:transcription factor A, mitochondrial isoform X2 [Agrilus planipennis]
MDIYSKQYLDYQGRLTPEQKEKLSQLRKERIEQKNKIRLKKKYRDANRPKRPLAPYFLFLAEKAKERNEKYNELAITLRHEWKQLSESEKQKYSDEFNKNIKEYEEAMKNWEANMIKEGHFDLVRGRALIEQGLKNSPQSTKLAKRIKKKASESNEP